MALQGLEEIMLVVRCLGGFEHVLVALRLLAKLPGDDFRERIEGALLCKIPAGIFFEQLPDEIVEASVIRGPDAWWPDTICSCFLAGLWWHWVAKTYYRRNNKTMIRI